MNFLKRAQPNGVSGAFEIASGTHIGYKRRQNQDRLIVFTITNDNSGSSDALVAAVADGMGGHTAGAEAAELAVNTVKSLITSLSDAPLKQLQRTADGLFSAFKVSGDANEQHRDMGTTLSLMLMTPAEGYCLHVGDSRIYKLNRKNLVQISTDHSFVQELIQSGVIGEEAAKTHPDRNMLTKALSGRHYSPPDIFGPIPLADGDTLLLCSDGLWGMLPDDQIQACLQNEDAAAAAQSLIEGALKAGGDDNIAVVVIKRKASATFNYTKL